MERNQKSLFGKKQRASGEKKANEFHSVCTNSVCAWLPWAPGLALQLTLGSSRLGSRLCAGGSLTFSAHPLLPRRGSSPQSGAVPQSICQQVCPNFPKPGQRILPLSTVAVLPLLQPDVLEVQCRRSPGPITGVMSIGWSRSVFPGKIWAARFLPFLKIQVELCFPL